MQDQFRRAKRALRWSERVAITVGIGAVFLVFIPEDRVVLAWVAGLISVLLLVCEQLLRYRFRRIYEDAEDIRRLFLLCDGLGQKPSPAEMARICTRFGESRVAASMEPYFTSPLPPGPKRLLMLVWESAFWSEDLQRLLERTFFRRALGTTAVAIVAALIALAGPEGPVALKVIAPALAALVGVNFWGKWWDAHLVEGLCREVAADCEARVARPWVPEPLAELREVVQIAMRYNAAIQTSYPPRDEMYKDRAETLNRQWASIVAGLGDSPQ